MTDITTPTMITSRSIRVPGLKVLMPGILRGMVAPFALCGRELTTILTAYGRALELVYSAPFSRRSQTRRLVSDEDLQGRDPNW